MTDAPAGADSGPAGAAGSDEPDDPDDPNCADAPHDPNRAHPPDDPNHTHPPDDPNSAHPPHDPNRTHPPHDPNRTDAPDDQALLAAHVAGDPQAFATLVARHRDRLWAVALRTMRNPDDAADALQDAYISAFRRAGTFRGDAAVTTWLHRIVVNACLDRLRRTRSRPSEPLAQNSDRAGELAASTGADPLEEKEQQSVVAAALATLNADQRAALVLVDMEGYSVEEAARMLGCAVGTVKSRCARGRAKLLPLLTTLRDPDAPDQAGPRTGPTRTGPTRTGPARTGPAPSRAEPRDGGN